MNEKPTYYAVIPSNVRYDKELNANAKLLYGEITALCNKDGKCYATNDYFSKIYEVSKKSVSNWINLLIKKGYILSKLTYKKGTKEIENRYLSLIIHPMEEKVDTPMEEKVHTYGRKGSYPMEEKVKDNNTSINTINNNNKLLLQKESEYFPDNKQLNDLFKDFLENRTELYNKKINTPRSIKIAINKLNKLDNDNDKITMLELCIERGYRGIADKFPNTTFNNNTNHDNNKINREHKERVIKLANQLNYKFNIINDKEKYNQVFIDNITKLTTDKKQQQLIYKYCKEKYGKTLTNDYQENMFNKNYFN